jgi:hypothetical protein
MFTFNVAPAACERRGSCAAVRAGLEHRSSRAWSGATPESREMLEAVQRCARMR